MLWPLTKANSTTELKCFSDLNNNLKSNKKAYRHCSISSNEYDEFNLKDNINNQIFSSWQSADISECVQDLIFKIKNEIYVFHTIDNFDESQIIIYLEKLYDLTIQFIKNSIQRTIYDISTVIDAMSYLINAQVIPFSFNSL